VRRVRGENDAALSAYERALAMPEARDPSSNEVATVIAHMAELCTRWDAKHPDLEGLIARGLAVVDGRRNREKVLLLAARSFMSRKKAKPTDEDWEGSLATAKEALAIAEELGLLREVSLCLDAVGYAYGELGNFLQSYGQGPVDAGGGKCGGRGARVSRREVVPRASRGGGGDAAGARVVRFPHSLLRTAGKRIQLSRDPQRRLAASLRRPGAHGSARGSRRGALGN